jgi:hypothetical protein
VNEPRGRRRLRGALFALIALLYVLSVPWYRQTGAEVDVLFGLPDWVAVALGCYLAAALCNALAWLLTDVPDDLPPGPSFRSQGGAPPGGEGAA